MLTDEKLWHYSNLNFKFDPNRKYEQGGNPCKPNGIWFSLSDDWEIWCRENEYHIENLATRSLVTIIDFSNILIIKDIEDLFSFIDEFYRPVKSKLYSKLDWNAVAKKHSGLILPDYYNLNNARYANGPDLGTIWVSTWDVPSGCIWDLSVLMVSEPEVT